MLPQNVRVLRRPHLLFWSSQLPRSRLQKDTTQEPVSEANVRGYQRGEGGGYSAASDADVFPPYLPCIQNTDMCLVVV